MCRVSSPKTDSLYFFWIFYKNTFFSENFFWAPNMDHLWIFTKRASKLFLWTFIAIYTHYTDVLFIFDRIACLMGPSTTFSTTFQTIYPFFPLPSCFWNSHHKTDIPHHLCDFPCLMQAKLPIWDTDFKKIPISVGVVHIRNLDEKIFNWIFLDEKLTAWSLQVHHSNPLSMSFQMI